MVEKTHGITVETVKNMVIDAGAVYIDYGLGTERLLGATRDGNTFKVEREIRTPSVDGALGPLKGSARKASANVSMVVNLIEITAANLKLALTASDMSDYPSTEAKTHDKIISNRDIADTDYVTNVALIGKVSGADEHVICIIDNGLCDGNLELAMKDKDESVIEMTFVGYYDPATPETEPWEIRHPLVPVSGS